ncbi:putative Mechanosensitive ion channel MscS [Vibrio nigripulchritudo SFn27]|uniref:Putative Mechanosensitive ion channel MscS n=1 Tax=Vibrio nigripulchritudo TaxID=28173 RepID=U4KD15_9VIBR|nr:mechanosensitive ion channel family protein [Vibrio nigripulchritudo]CCN82101.1 putative Mechanosensitive ion channel MscS [Vibrio nigripulchritudo BLFn1]CCN86443.1 putative Mechanosensitive ion channel MscS [Vibrio nigripulchritudo SFn27]CCN96754.1 putative Mechanosensitive ion channel MscS [Vibrio nigripulchritudo ENn2]CCO40272.1 putative Mechanosensitive ion channel MscS [Vibrio nigripulchritudo SFn135]CCO55032.1 putative Mechanosensitive ion channel MscS [Vibrio nigripulchritudo Wn13]
MDNLASSITQQFHLLEQSWFGDVVIMTSISFVAWIAWRILYGRIETLASKTTNRWDDAIVHSLKTPISALIWGWPAMVSIGLILQTYLESSLNWLETLKLLLGIAVAVWIVLRLITNVEDEILSQKKRDETTVQAIAKVARLVFIIMGVLSVMQSLGLSLSGLLTFGGVGGLIVGLAAKDLLSNFFGGMMIYFDRPFKVGDWVRSPDRQIEGTVERIGWRMTIIRTFDKRPLYVPNSVFSNIVVENPSRMLNRRIYETIGLRYDDNKKVDAIIADVKTMLQNHPDIDTNQTLIVNFNAFGASSLDFFVYTFTKTVNWVRFHEVKQDVLLKIMAIIHEHDADVAYPTQTLKLDHPEGLAGLSSPPQQG